ncbi:hypothetical protein SAMN05216334_12343 [Nitrosomonas ureae]|uniref:Uncharacterized protein n=2 Tax=Nitrosomonas ureae TaxID=44577 RepID=A0A1H5X2E6_9PROT|nr:hypothetical protein SAMN05216334_12343 [Nitrosomonas ureae]
MENSALLGLSIDKYNKLASSALDNPLNLDIYKNTIDTLNTPKFSKVESKLPKSAAHLNLQLEMKEKENREREEMLQLNRVIGEMTQQSAMLLKDLSKVAAIFLERFDLRSEQSDIHIKKQIKIALYTLGVSALLSFATLIYTISSYNQNADDNLRKIQLYNINKELRELQRLEKEKNLQLENKILDMNKIQEDSLIIKPNKKPQ